MRISCNPLNLPYRYQFAKQGMAGHLEADFRIYREAADPSLILFQDLYYLFPSMTAGFYTSQDLCHWDFHEFLSEMPIFDYAPDVRVIGEYLYFCASHRESPCDFYRSKDPVHEPFEKILGTFEFWDPNLFLDDNGRLYFYWGCTNTDPIWGVELDKETMQPLTQPIALFDSDIHHLGYERNGEDHLPSKTDAENEAMVARMLAGAQQQPELLRKILHIAPDADMEIHIRKMFSNRPYIEGPWMTKKDGKYYLQYAIPGTQYNIYSDCVCVSDSPLGGYTRAQNNPYSYQPGGFITGAGHGSTLEDREGSFWHTSTLRISRNHDFERRLGLWKAGFDQDGELYCDQNYGDWPMDLDAAPFSDPKWMLLSYGKAAVASSGENPESVVNEDIRSWWTAGNEDQPWVQVDLGKVMEVHAIQVNFADAGIHAPAPENQSPRVSNTECRYIDLHTYRTRWLLEGSADGESYFIIEDKREAQTDLPHDLVLREDGISVRYIRLTVTELPYGQTPKVSGLRIFGSCQGSMPQAPSVQAEVLGPMDVRLSWQDTGAAGYNVRFGHAPDKLYHSYLVYGTEVTLRAFSDSQEKYICVDAFNECGIAKGSVAKV